MQLLRLENVIGFFVPRLKNEEEKPKAAQARCSLLAACCLMPGSQRAAACESALSGLLLEPTPREYTRCPGQTPRMTSTRLSWKPANLTQGAEVGLHLPGQLIVSSLGRDWLFLHSVIG